MEIAGALETLGPDAAPARRVGIGHKTEPIFITVDPERDTPDVRRNTPRRSIHASSDLPAVRNRSPLLSRPMVPTARLTKPERATKTTSSTMVLTSTLWTPRANSCEA